MVILTTPPAAAGGPRDTVRRLALTGGDGAVMACLHVPSCAWRSATARTSPARCGSSWMVITLLVKRRAAAAAAGARIAPASSKGGAAGLKRWRAGAAVCDDLQESSPEQLMPSVCAAGGGAGEGAIHWAVTGLAADYALPLAGAAAGMDVYG